MRISSNQLFRVPVDTMLERQAELANTQQQISSGKRIQTASDDPIATAKAISVRDAIAKTQSYERNIEMARSHMESQEQVLQGATDVLQRLNEMAIRANNDTQSDEQRGAMAIEIEERLQELLALANSRAVNGDYLFSGYQSQTRSFVTGPSGVMYQGDQGQRHLRISDTMQIAISDSGADVFRDIRNGNGDFVVGADAANTGTGVIDTGSLTDLSAWDGDSYDITFTTPNSFEVRDSGGALVTSGSHSDGDAIAFNGVEVRISGQPEAGDVFTVAASQNQDVFSTAQNLIDALRIPTGSVNGKVQARQALTKSIADVDQALENILTYRTTAGGRLNALDTELNANQAANLQLEEARSELEDVDIIEASSRLNQGLLYLEASQRSFSLVQSMTLFEFI